MSQATTRLRDLAPIRPDDVKYVGAINGCYAVSGEARDDENKVPVYACRLCAITPYQATMIAPVTAEVGQIVVGHFRDFGILRGHVSRKMSDGFIIDLDLNDEQRIKLAAKIKWRKTASVSKNVEQREHPRVLPRQPRTAITMADGKRYPCFVVDVSQSGAALSSSILPAKNTVLAVGSVIGRVVRRLPVGFAVEFVEIQQLADVEHLLVSPPSIEIIAGLPSPGDQGVVSVNLKG